MKYKLNWQNEEEGSIFFEEAGSPFLTVQFFVTGEEEAEFRLQDIVLLEQTTKIDNIHNEIILKMTKCIMETFRLLWEEGLDETILVESKGTKIADILDSTEVVRRVYSEYMMRCYFETQKTTDCGLASLKLTKTEDGYLCENKEKTFFCRLLNYTSNQPEEQSFYLYEVEVKEKERNRGVATACLTELFRQLASEMPVTVFLQVGSYNEPAVHLYQKLGFEISEELCYYAAQE